MVTLETGKPYKIVMQKLRRSTVPVSETLDRNFLSTVLNYLFPERINRYPTITTEGHTTDDDVSEAKLKLAARRMKNGISPGIDGITAEMIARAFESSQQTIRNTFNKCFKKGHFPRAWEEGRLVLIKKPLKPENVTILL